MRRRALISLVTTALTSSCGQDLSSDTASPPMESPSAVEPSPTIGTPGQASLADIEIRLVEVATLQQPLAMATRPGSRDLYVAEKTGAVVVIRGGRVDSTPVLDLGGEVSIGGEQGLLGIAFGPDGEELFVNYTDTGGDTHVVAYRMTGDRADLESRRELLRIEQPYANHNGGHLAFGPDGYLYIGMGDGGSGGDPHGNGQSTTTLLGKMLRIDPRAGNGRAYQIPSDNPFVGRQDVRPEIWATGLRNPWRYSFDRETGDLWIGDVGQTEWEEVDVQAAGSSGGENYGWNIFEGDHEFAGDEVPGGSVRPAYEYSHAEGGCTVVGGYVYRGDAIPELRGVYVFGDYCIGEIEALRVEGGRVADHRSLGPVVSGLTSFGEDGRGELYAMSLGGGVFRLAPAG
jgi:glucose/arabinose dehydrogenase